MEWAPPHEVCPSLLTPYLTFQVTSQSSCTSSYPMFYINLPHAPTHVDSHLINNVGPHFPSSTSHVPPGRVLLTSLHILIQTSRTTSFKLTLCLGKNG